METTGMREGMFRNYYFHGNQSEMDASEALGEFKRIRKDTGVWIYWLGEKAVHKRGYREGTDGASSSRQVEDADIEMMSKLLKESKWDFSCTPKEERAMIKDAELLPQIEEKLKLAQCVSRAIPK